MLILLKTENTVVNNFKIRLNSTHVGPNKDGQTVYATKRWDVYSTQWLNCVNGQTCTQYIVAKLREWTNCTVYMGPSKDGQTAWIHEWLNVH